MTTVEYGIGLEQRIFYEVDEMPLMPKKPGNGLPTYPTLISESDIYSVKEKSTSLRPTLPKITSNTSSLLETYISTVGKGKVTPEDVSLLTKLEGLDLDPIKVKLMDAEEGYGWTRDQADAAATAYKQFLFVSAKYEDSSIVPTKLVDKVWHYHILDTGKYAEDSQEVFGRFLHHFPYFGMRGEEDAANLKASFKETLDLFVENFGVSQLAGFDQENMGAQGIKDLTADSSSSCGGPVGCRSAYCGGSCEHY